MTRDDFLHYLNNGDLRKFKWYEEFFTIPMVGEEYEYFSYSEQNEKNNEVIPYVGSSIISMKDRETPLLLSDTVDLLAGDLNNAEDGTYTLTDIIHNYLLIFYPLGRKLPFTHNLHFSVVEDFIAYELSNTVTTDEYMKYMEATDMLQQMAELFVVSSTDKSIGPAPGIKELKNKLLKEYRAKYGDKMDSDIKYMVEIDKLLIEYDRNYIKDDPTYGVVLTEKILTNARKNLYGILGSEIGLDGKITPIVENSLSEGYPADNKQLASLFNSSRQGSIMRGHMTQFTGADANTTSRVINVITVVPNDCGTTKTLEVDINESNASEYIFYYMLENSKPVLITKDNIKAYIGKKIKLRTYLECIEPNGKYCSTCAGKQGEDNKKIATILSTENNAIFTNSSMKAMHDKTLSLVEYDLKTAIF